MTMHSIDAMRMLFDYADKVGKHLKDVNPKQAAQWGFENGYYDNTAPDAPENEADLVALVSQDVQEIIGVIA